MKLTDEAITQAARERLGVVDANIVRYRDRQTYIGITGEGMLTDCCGGVWYALAVKAREGAPFEVIARRRTTGELMKRLALASNQ